MYYKLSFNFDFCIMQILSISNTTKTIIKNKEKDYDI